MKSNGAPISCRHTLHVLTSQMRNLTMVFKPQHKTYACAECGWRKTVAPDSDVMFEGLNRFRACPECGNQELRIRKPNWVELAWLGMSRSRR